MYQLNFDFDAFLKTYWQKKPTVIRKGFDNFEDALTPDELAGLAMEEEVDSRLVIQKDGQWLVSHGPFDSFDELPDTGSQLIVQASNHWHPGPQALAEPFRILPGWLFDDVMICYSLPGGGVGPHIDQYDVFIIQGSGRRHWRVGDLGNYEEANLHTGLRQITGFDAIIDTVLEPGDILYIPPGFPHEGTSLEESMSFSVGYRSPKKQELLSSFADFAIANEAGDIHYHNPDMEIRQAHSAITADDFDRLDTMLMKLASDKDLKRRWMGEYLSQSRHELDVVPAEPNWRADELVAFLEEGAPLSKVAGLRTFYYPDMPHLMFINGETFELPEGCSDAAKVLCDQESVTGADLSHALNNPAFLDCLVSLSNLGYWYPED